MQLFACDTRLSFTATALAMAALTAACGDSNKNPEGQSQGGAERAGELVTYQGDLRALIEANCVECHQAGGIGPMQLDDWEHVKAVAPQVVNAVTSGVMPPWPADDSCREMVDARGLSQEVKDLFASWREGGYAEGKEADYVAPEPRRRLSIGEPTQVYVGDAPFTPAPNSDTYRCFYVGAVERDTYLTAVDIIPEVTSEVHHVQFHRVDAENIAAVKAMQDIDNDGGYACGSSGVGGNVLSQNMFSYRPGSLAVVFNQGDAAYLKKGSGLVLQIHYNTQFLPSGVTPEPDATKLALWALPENQPPQHVIYRTGVLSPLSGKANGNLFAFYTSSIPANQTVIGESTLPMSQLSRIGSGLNLSVSSNPYIPGEIVGMTPHAHSWATRMTATINKAGVDQCLVEVPNWDYGWQLDYLFKEGLAFGPEDQLHVECHYDNTAENQPVLNGMRRSPQTITFGENTLNEMCLHYLWLRYTYADFMAGKPAQ